MCQQFLNASKTSVLWIACGCVRYILGLHAGLMYNWASSLVHTHIPPFLLHTPTHPCVPTWITALNQQVFPTLRMPTGQSSWRIQSVGLQASLDRASHRFLLTLAPLSSALASRALADRRAVRSNTQEGDPALSLEDFTFGVIGSNGCHVMSSSTN